jgi:hypothetical protein
LTIQIAGALIRPTKGCELELKDIEKRDPFIRASGWTTSFLEPVFQSLAKELEEKGYQASVHWQDDLTLTLVFSKVANRFEYTLDCRVKLPLVPNWPEGHIGLGCSRRLNYTAEPVLFREATAVYDIKDVSEQEIKLHFRNTFQRWLIP